VCNCHLFADKMNRQIFVPISEMETKLVGPVDCTNIPSMNVVLRFGNTFQNAKLEQEGYAKFVITDS
jgi:hypothetical protein